MVNQHVVALDLKIPRGMTQVPVAESIWDILRSDPHLTKLAAAFERSGMLRRLSGSDPITLLAPNDEALAALDVPELHSAEKLLGRHIVHMALSEDELRAAGEIRTEQDTHVRVTDTGRETLVGNARIVRPDIECANGIIHVIDRVL